MARVTFPIGKLMRQLRHIREVMHAEAAYVARDARAAAPSDTGLLKNSITRRRSPQGAVVTADTDYAVFVEFAEQPYLRPALDNNAAQIQKAARQAVKDAMKL